jgi:hypothetical protein
MTEVWQEKKARATYACPRVAKDWSLHASFRVAAPADYIELPRLLVLLTRHVRRPPVPASACACARTEHVRTLKRSTMCSPVCRRQASVSLHRRTMLILCTRPRTCRAWAQSSFHCFSWRCIICLLFLRASSRCLIL